MLASVKTRHSELVRRPIGLVHFQGTTMLELIETALMSAVSQVLNLG